MTRVSPELDAGTIAVLLACWAARGANLVGAGLVLLARLTAATAIARIGVGVDAAITAFCETSIASRAARAGVAGRRAVCRRVAHRVATLAVVGISRGVDAARVTLGEPTRAFEITLRGDTLCGAIRGALASVGARAAVARRDF